MAGIQRPTVRDTDMRNVNVSQDSGSVRLELGAATAARFGAGWLSFLEPDDADELAGAISAAAESARKHKGN